MGGVKGGEGDSERGQYGVRRGGGSRGGEGGGGGGGEKSGERSKKKNELENPRRELRQRATKGKTEDNVGMRIERGKEESVEL